MYLRMSATVVIGQFLQNRFVVPVFFPVPAGQPCHGLAKAGKDALPEGREQLAAAAAQCRGDVIFALGQRLPGGIDHLHDGVDEFPVLRQRLPADGVALTVQIPAQLRPLALALQDQAVAFAFQPGRGVQNGHHGVRPHPRADHAIKFPGDIADAVGQAEGHALLHAEFFRVADGALQGHFPDVGGNDRAGNAVFQKVNAEITVVTAHVRHPVAGLDIAAAGQQAVGKGNFHGRPSFYTKKAIPAIVRDGAAGILSVLLRGFVGLVGFQEIVQLGEERLAVHTVNHAGFLNGLAPGRGAAQAVHTDGKEQRRSLRGYIQNIADDGFFFNFNSHENDLL